MRFPRLEEKILADLREHGEARPPAGRFAQECFWIAASRLRSEGLCVADQRSGVVRPSPSLIIDGMAARHRQPEPARIVRTDLRALRRRFSFRCESDARRQGYSAWSLALDVFRPRFRGCPPWGIVRAAVVRLTRHRDPEMRQALAALPAIAVGPVPAWEVRP